MKNEPDKIRLILSIENINKNLFMFFRSGRLEYGAYLLCDTPLTPDDLAHIAFGHLELEGDNIVLFHLLNGYPRGVIHKVFNDIVQDLFKICAVHSLQNTGLFQ